MRKDSLVGKITPEIVREVIGQHQRLGKEDAVEALSQLDHVLAGMPQQASVAEMLFGCAPAASRAIHVDLIYLGMKIAERALTGHVETTERSFGFGRAA